MCRQRTIVKAPVHVSTAEYSHVHLRKGWIVGCSNNRSWQLSVAHPRLSAAIPVGACCVFLSAHMCSCVSEATHTSCDNDPKRSEVWLTSASVADALSRHQTLRESCSLCLNGAIPTSSHFFPVQCVSLSVGYIPNTPRQPYLLIFSKKIQPSKILLRRQKMRFCLVSKQHVNIAESI